MLSLPVHPSINFTSNFVTLTGLKLPKAKQLLKKERALVQKPLAHYTKILEILEPFTPVFAQSKESTSLLLSSPPIIQRNIAFLQECGAAKASAEIITGYLIVCSAYQFNMLSCSISKSGVRISWHCLWGFSRVMHMWLQILT